MEHGIEIKPCWWLEDLMSEPRRGYGFEIVIEYDEGFTHEYFFGHSPNDTSWERTYNKLFFSQEEMNDHIVRNKEYIIRECESKIKEYTDKLNSLK